MIDIFRAVLELYPQVVVIRDTTAYDVDGNVVDYDLALVTAQAKKDYCKERAKELLSKSDWSALSDVGLKNLSTFVTYRGILRGYVISPVEEPDFPVEPTPIWE